MPIFSVGQGEMNFFGAGKPGRDEGEMLEILGVDGWVRYYEFVTGKNPFPALDNMIIEAKLGLSVIMHVYIAKSDHSIETHVALFLIARADKFFFMASTGWLSDNWHWHKEYDQDYGRPLAFAKKKIVRNIMAPANMSASTVTYTREYTKCRVTLTCALTTESLSGARRLNHHTPAENDNDANSECVGKVMFIA